MKDIKIQRIIWEIYIFSARGRCNGHIDDPRFGEDLQLVAVVESIVYYDLEINGLVGGDGQVVFASRPGGIIFRKVLDRCKIEQRYYKQEGNMKFVEKTVQTRLCFWALILCEKTHA